MACCCPEFLPDCPFAKKVENSLSHYDFIVQASVQVECLWGRDTDVKLQIVSKEEALKSLCNPKECLCYGGVKDGKLTQLFTVSMPDYVCHKDDSPCSDLHIAFFADDDQAIANENGWLTSFRVCVPKIKLRRRLT